MAENYPKVSAENIISKLLCYKCKKVPNLKNPEGFQCKGQLHFYCKKCFVQEPTCCIQVKKEDPCQLFSSFVKELPQYCENFKNGCREIIRGKDKYDHEQFCVFREVNCAALSCKEKIVFHEFLDHLKLKHDKALTKVKSLERKNEFILYCNFTNWETIRWNSKWSPDEVCMGDLRFYFTGCTLQSHHFWLYFYGNPTEAEHFEYSLSLKSKDTKISFKGKVIPLDKNKEEILKDQPTFVISKNVMLSMMKSLDTENLPISLRIRNLKEEAKDDEEESDISDVSE